MDKKLFEKKVKKAPISPGCYLWKDSNGKILYIGKAINIRKRASSYYLNYERLDLKIKKMVDQISDVDFFEVDSEVEALILETNLIKKYKPKYNKLMKDDKNYVYLMIDWYRDFPSIKIVREKNDKKGEYYGPYPQKFPVSKVLASLRKIYPYCDSSSWVKGLRFNLEEKPCFNYHLGLCSGVCAGLIGKKEHRKNINGIRNFFKGKKGVEIEKIKKNMEKLAKQKKFEEAARMRDRLRDLEYVTQRIKIDRDIDDELLEKTKSKANEKALTQMINSLKEIPNVPNILSTHENFKSQMPNNEIFKGFRIECYDISNISGTNAVGSMVVFLDGKPEKSMYRKFKIRTKTTPDDFAMMKEILLRRISKLEIRNSNSQTKSKFQKPDSSIKKNINHSSSTIHHLKTNGWEKPDLIIVDGGKGQLSSAYQILKSFNLINEIVLVGLAKREEEIFFVKNKTKHDLKFGKILLPRKSDSLYLIQRIRDEAHRYAIGYHRRLRSKMQTYSILDDIPGIGEVIKKRLLTAFGSIENIKKQSLGEINTIVRNKKTAGNIAIMFGIEKV